MGSLSIIHWLALLIFLLPIVIGLAVMGRQKSVMVKHQQSGIVKKGYYGYSWTYLLFGWLVPIFRGEIGVAVLHLVLTLVTFFLFQLIMSFLYNKQYMTRLLTSGWKLCDEEATMAAARLKLGIANPTET